jgi:hypothetical protein
MFLQGKGCLHYNLRLQEAVSPDCSSLFFLIAYPFIYVLIFQPHFFIREERLKGLKKPDSYGMNCRTDCVKKQGWATMPGEKEPYGRAAGEVADLLASLKCKERRVTGRNTTAG